MSTSTKLIRNSTAEFLIFTGQAGEQSIEARYEQETVWLTQKLLAELFAVDVRTVSEHLKNIYESDELERAATLRKFRTVQTEGHREVARNIDFYNLDAIISVGYRVNSVRATQFRQWAKGVLREFAKYGFLSVSSTKNSPTSTPWRWTTTAMRQPPKSSSPRYKISCTSLSTATRQLN